MKICKAYFIPCPNVESTWSRLPCCADEKKCGEWRKKAESLSFEKSGLTLNQFVQKARELYASKGSMPTVVEVIDE